MQVKKNPKRSRKTAQVISRSGAVFWTTQTQFWQWFREQKLIKTADSPLTGRMASEDEESLVVISNTLLNLAHQNHLREALDSRRKALNSRKN
jgi:hypothetical protein